jgi:type IV pilus assembly protein PilQ
VQAARKSEQILGARSLDEFLTGGGRFFGRPISIQTNDAEVRDVISFIAEESGVNLVMGDDVDGKISLKLRQVPWDQALVIVMRSRNLGYVRQGNVIRITKLSTLQAEAQSAKQIVEAQQSLTPLKVKVFPVSYASVNDLAGQIKPFLTDKRGQVVSDPRTTSLIVTDTAPVLQRIERLVKELDIPPAQVMIEGKIVEATETFSRSLGVNWTLGGAPMTLSKSGGYNGTAILGNTSLSISNLGTAVPQTGVMNLHVGYLDIIGNLDATLGLAQSDSLVKIISSPRIVTMNKEKSEISQKSQVIYITTNIDPTGNKSTTPKSTDVELKLAVTPQITTEGSVVLDVDLTRQFAGAIADATSGARPINSRQAKTKVLVPNGQTAVIGGIYQSDETETENGVPGLKNIPVFGWLFKSRSEERTKNELLLFLTPRILNAKDQAANGGS